MKLKSLTTATYVALGCMSLSVAHAASNAIPVGPNLGYGDASNNHTIFSTTANPAWIGGNLHEENNYGFGIAGATRIKQNSYNELNAQFQNDVKPLLQLFDGNNNQSALLKAEEIKSNLNNLIRDTRDNFYSQQDFAASAPVAITNNNWGGFGIEVSGNVIGREKLLSSDIATDINTSYLLANPNATVEQMIENGLDIQSAIYIKTATYGEAAVSYGNQFFENQYGRLAVGIKAKYMQAKLVKSVNSVDKYLKAAARGDDLADQLKEDLKDHGDITGTDSAIGVDLGAMWLAENWMAGISVLNVNSPKFTYNRLGEQTTGKSQSQVLTERFYGNQINLTEEIELKALTRLEGAIYSENRHWTLAASYDVNATNDLVNQEYQWATVSVSYATDSGGSWVHALIPDVRIGYRKNMAGDERNYYTPGFTWGPLTLDVAFAEFSDIEKAMKGDPNDIPEAFMASLGLEFYF